MKKLKKLYLHDNLTVFLLNLICGIFAFAWVMAVKGGLFSVAGDFNVQQIPFAMYANDAIKAGQTGWDWSLDLGSGFIGGMSFYILGNPSFWLSMLFPSDCFMYLVGWIYILKYAAAGLFSYLYMKRYVKHREAAVIASVMYAFSGYMAEDLLFYHFHDVAALFPLLLLTLDELVEKNRRGPFIFAVAINALVNYFFFPGEVIFLVAYFLFRFVMVNGRMEWKKVPVILLEAVFGGLLTCVLLLPSAIFTLQNPRVKLDYTGSNALIFTAERYLYILKAMIFPGEVMSDQSAVINHNFSSCAAYIPMAGMILVIAFFMMEKKHWLKGMLKFCLVMAVVPILNASFSMFSGLYHRWYYMPVLLFALSGAMVLDRLFSQDEVFESPTPSEKAISKATIIWLLITAAFILFLLFVPWSTSENTKVYRYDVFAVWAAISVGGTLLTWILMTQLKKHRKAAVLAGICLFAAGTTAAVLWLYQIANGEDAYGLHDRITASAQFTYTEPEYRYTNRDNPETLTHGIAASANFCSTVQGSIFRFYESLGLSRDVKSPDAPEGLNELISARYTYERTERADETALETVSSGSKTYYVYQDESVPPIGFTYDTYMTRSEFMKTTDTTRCIVMLKTLVIPDDMEAEVSKVLRHYDEAVDGEATSEYLKSISSAHLEEASTDVVRTTDSYASTIICDKEKYAFFSIPDDTGWSAEVNGEEAEIIDINGFMAVKVQAGENRIVFRYTTPGLKTGACLTGVGLTASGLYLAYFAVKKRKKGRT